MTFILKTFFNQGEVRRSWRSSEELEKLGMEKFFFGGVTSQALLFLNECTAENRFIDRPRLTGVDGPPVVTRGLPVLKLTARPEVKTIVHQSTLPAFPTFFLEKISLHVPSWFPPFTPYLRQ